ncbi:Trm112 family protein [Luteimonas yindakuii]|uniref:Trm112 family protein n=1 Tax=Luteimonas yindakuii TaxID=2565782 RepID=A0A4Z1RCH1_9GAMM|nr:Trm112 family protein [Luteimonas yindakuii]TKS54508.1 Trm112 family protein [Luteimonas yindakuii]
MDRKLLDILVCPASRQPLALLDNAGLDALNRAIATGTVQRDDGATQSSPLRAALVTRDHKRVYRVDDGIPVLLVEEAIATGQIDGFPAAPAR